MVKEYEGNALYCSLILCLKLLPLPYLIGASLFSHRLIHTEGSHKRVPYKVHNAITLTLKKRSFRVTLQWRQEDHDDFPKVNMMSLQSINLNSIIPLL